MNSVPWFQIAALILLAQAFRNAGRWLGPRRTGLVMGLPSTTALVLVGTGLEGGTALASVAAESSLLGLVASATVPLVYATAIGGGARPFRPVALTIASYLAATLALRSSPGPGAAGSVGFALAALAVLCALARRVERDALGEEPRPDSQPLPPAALAACRTVLPAAHLLAVRALGSWAGAEVGGLFVTFPGASLTVLVTTHLEAGPRAASRLALAMPWGASATFAFLTAFRFGCPTIGLAPSAALGAALALLTLAAVDRARGQGGPPSLPGRAHSPFIREGGRRVDPGARTWPAGRRPARFAPRLECLAG